MLAMLVKLVSPSACCPICVNRKHSLAAIYGVFLDGGNAHTSSGGAVSWTVTAGINDNIQGAGTYTLQFAVVPSTNMTGVASVSGWQMGNTKWAVGASNISASRTGTIAAALPGANPGSVFIKVDGSTTLDTRTFTTTVTNNFENQNFLDETYIINPSHEWTINGYQGVVNYLNTNTNYPTFVRVTNRSTISAEVYVNAWDDSGNMDTCTLTTIPAGQTKLYWAADIKALMSGITTTSFAALFTVAAPAGMVHFTAVQKDAVNGGQRVLPVYANGAAGAWGY